MALYTQFHQIKRWEWRHPGRPDEELRLFTRACLFLVAGVLIVIGHKVYTATNKDLAHDFTFAQPVINYVTRLKENLENVIYHAITRIQPIRDPIREKLSNEGVWWSPEERSPILIRGGEALVDIKGDRQDSYPKEKIILSNLNEQKEQLLDFGELDIVNFTNLIELPESGTILFVSYARPVFDEVNDRIFYGKTLYRNFAKEGESIILSSEIWTYDLSSGEKELIYAGKENSFISKIAVSSDGSTLIFSETREMDKNERRIALPLDDEIAHKIEK